MMRGDLRGQVRRFALVGVTNTALTGLLLLTLIPIVGVVWAYTFAFATGVVYAAYLSRRYVFRSSAGHAAVVRFVAGYVMVYLAGRGLLAIIGGTTTAPDWAAAVLVVGFTAPLSFAVGRWTLAAGSDQADVSVREDPSTT